MYIHELKKWPKFFWDKERVTTALIQLHHLQGRLIGGMESIGFNLQEKAILQSLTQEVVKSSEIEGEILDQSSVRSSVARHLGMNIAPHRVDRRVDSIVEMMLDATEKFDQPLTKKRLFYWHASLFPEKRSGFKKICVGAWRKNPVQVVSGHMGREIVHFEAPSAKRVAFEMKLFLNWLNHETEVDLVLKAAIAHLWFVTIHPFDDGNGRIGRAIVDFMFARAEKSSRRFYSLSAQIQKERKGYYAILEQTQKGSLDITLWIVWFIECQKRAIEEALSTLNQSVRKAQFWQAVASIPLNERQRKILNLLLDGFEGKLTSSKWAEITKCSQDTAYRDIHNLIEQNILFKNPEGGRSTSYSLNFKL